MLFCLFMSFLYYFMFVFAFVFCLWVGCYGCMLALGFGRVLHVALFVLFYHF